MAGLLFDIRISLVIAVIGLFGWTGFSLFLRGEFFKQQNLTYVEACHALGHKDGRIIYSHILPNAVPPLLILLPFAIMGAISSEAVLPRPRRRGLLFLGGAHGRRAISLSRRKLPAVASRPPVDAASRGNRPGGRYIPGCS